MFSYDAVLFVFTRENLSTYSAMGTYESARHVSRPHHIEVFHGFSLEEPEGQGDFGGSIPSFAVIGEAVWEGEAQQ